MGQEAREALRVFIKEAEALGEHPSEELVAAYRKRAPPIIQAACEEQYEENGSVMAPNMCYVCRGCVLGDIVNAIGEINGGRQGPDNGKRRKGQR